MILVATTVLLASCTGGLSDGVADLHIDTPYHVRYRERPANLEKAGSRVTTKSLREGCVDYLVLSLYIPSGLRPTKHTKDEFDNVLVAAKSIERSTPNIGHVVYATEGAQALADHIDEIPQYVEQDVRLYGVVHSWHNDLADSVKDPHPGRGGLTEKGERFVRAVYAAGGLVDVSHMSDDTFADTARIAKELDKPLVASHSNARAVTAHKRNLTDTQLRAVAASGGVVGVNFHAPFAGKDVAAHIDHMIEIMGEDHVAIGSDLDGLIRPVPGLDSHAGLPALAARLEGRGYSPQRLRKLFKGNVVRVLGPGG